LEEGFFATQEKANDVHIRAESGFTSLNGKV